MTQHLMPGIWADDDGDIHISVTELLAVFGWSDTAEHRQLVTRIARDAVREQFPDVDVTETD